uniref:hypothetical protein n=1 Tax=Flavobacterium macacae TaxID=2488993 RepID=UPI003741F2DA
MDLEVIWTRLGFISSMLLNLLRLELIDLSNILLRLYSNSSKIVSKIDASKEERFESVFNNFGSNPVSGVEAMLAIQISPFVLQFFIIL